MLLWSCPAPKLVLTQWDPWGSVGVSGSKMLAAKPLILITSRDSINLAQSGKFGYQAKTSNSCLCYWTLCALWQKPLSCWRTTQLCYHKRGYSAKGGGMCQQASSWMAGSRFPRPTLPKAYLPPQCILSPCVPQISDAKGKEDYQTRPHPASNTWTWRGKYIPGATSKLGHFPLEPQKDFVVIGVQFAFWILLITFCSSSLLKNQVINLNRQHFINNKPVLELIGFSCFTWWQFHIVPRVF